MVSLSKWDTHFSYMPITFQLYSEMKKVASGLGWGYICLEPFMLEPAHWVSWWAVRLNVSEHIFLSRLPFLITFAAMIPTQKGSGFEVVNGVDTRNGSKTGDVPIRPGELQCSWWPLMSLHKRQNPPEVRAVFPAWGLNPRLLIWRCSACAAQCGQ